MNMVYFLPIISAMIGWITNYLAIKMLFYPREERNFILFRFQGIFPKRQRALARKLAKIVSSELFTVENLKAKLDQNEIQQDLKAEIEREVEQYLREKLEERAPFLKGLIDDRRIIQIRDLICREIELLMPKIMAKLTEKIENVDIEEIVYEKVSNFSSEKLEALLLGVIKKELKFIEIAGAVLGFVIGLFQVLLIEGFYF